MMFEMFLLIYSKTLLCSKPPYFQVVQLSLAAGVVRPLQPNKEIMLNDRFFIGGPLNLRGFNVKGVGPHSEGIEYLIIIYILV